MKKMSRRGALVAIALAVSACGQGTPTEFELTTDGLKSLDRNITKVEVIDQADGSTKFVDVVLAQGVVWGGQSDWNAVATTSHRLMSTLFKKPEISRVRIVFVDPDKPIDWAQVRAARADLPKGWEELTYLQFFALTKAMAGTLETGSWLCDFYAKYASANPQGDGHLRYCRG